MRRGQVVVAGVSAGLALVMLAAISGAFTASERQTIQALRERIVRLEGSAISHATQLEQLWDATSALDVRVDNLELAQPGIWSAIDLLGARVEALEDAAPPFTFSNITATPSATCTAASCYVDIQWNVEPCATGQIEYGLTQEYGSVSTYEDELLCFHRQRITGLAPGTTYHYRVIATDGGDVIAYHVVA